ncbi:hypothetical protein OGATHE_005573 [Ogataea polymorpha]|uniref:Uncharacterized protein n=1 Tax=Ogataea polymorpha TaxID=460523 RepID=A0A9P8NS65_9ASCO|nr:hypothetical protein OGATHE_005573 [Ogataea polymorpha]
MLVVKANSGYNVVVIDLGALGLVGKQKRGDIDFFQTEVVEDVPEGDFARGVAVKGPITVREQKDATDSVRFGEAWGGHKVVACDLQHAGKLLPIIDFRIFLEHLHRVSIKLLYRLQLVDTYILQFENGQYAVDRRVLSAAVEDEAPEPRVGLCLGKVSNQTAHTRHDPSHMAT